MMNTVATAALQTKPQPQQLNKRLRLIAGSANPALADEMSCILDIPLTPILFKRFADGETYVQIQDSIRGCHVYLIQPTCLPVNDHLTELLIMIDACRRASAAQITAVIPYYGYARADRKTVGRESITAKLVANLITTAGADRVLVMDLHSAQIQGYFDIPFDHLHGMPVILNYLLRQQIPDLVVVSPDVGGVARARSFAKQFNDAPLVIVDKRRQPNSTVEVSNLIGDVAGKNVILVDDMIDTAATFHDAACLLHQAGANRIYACATHAVLSPSAIHRLSSGLFEEVIVTNTIPIEISKQFEQLKILSIANVFAEAIRCNYVGSSMENSLG